VVQGINRNCVLKSEDAFNTESVLLLGVKTEFVNIYMYFALYRDYCMNECATKRSLTPLMLRLQLVQEAL
jgi:hypothetical protein